MKKVLIFIFLAVTSTASANQWSFNQPMCGAPAIGLAGAYTAVADDVSVVCYNPAGLAFVNSKKMSSSVTSFEVTKETAIDAIDSGNSEFTSVGVKGFIGGMTSDPVLLPKFPVALVIDVPRAEDSHGSFKFDTSALNVRGAETRYTESSLDRVVMVAAAARPASFMSIGTAVGFQNSSTKSTTATSAIIASSIQNEGNFVNEADHTTADLWFLIYRLGALYQFSDHLKFGVTFSYGTPIKQNQSTEVSVNVTTLKSITSDTGTYQSSETKVVHYDFESGFGYARLPFKTRVGMSYDVAPNWRLSADLQHVIPPRTDFEPKEGVAPVVDAAVGLTTTAWDAVKIYSGVLTLRDTRRKVSQETASRVSGRHIDEYGVTFLAALPDGPSEYAIGGYYFQGEGYGRHLNASESITLGQFKTMTYQITASLSTSM